MPELPEVETISRILEPQLTGRTITRLTLNRLDIVERPAPEVFAATAAGAAITGIFSFTNTERHFFTAIFM